MFMATEDRYFASGTRLAIVYELDQVTGRIAATNMTPYYGLVMYGIKGLNVNITEPRKITHVGQDRPLQIDYLPAQEAMDAEITTSATELNIESATAGTLTETLGTGRINPLQTSQMGFEPVVGFWAARQTENTSGLRRWESYVFSAAKMIFMPSAMTDATADLRYKIAPSIATKKLWGPAWTLAINGATTAQMAQMATTGYPYLVGWKNAVATTIFPFDTDKPANASGVGSILGGWVNDVLTPTSDYTAAAASFTFHVAPGLDTDGAGKIVTCVYEGPLLVRV
jgi:hypothetical protein